ncbi:ABC transporter substrate-binding protein [Pseudomonas alcaligenes]|uniref:ABC transporter substrate-binding protein n=1 Tax=Aquipseudomonas alcaligenes TaxID=43263 RepID=A0ABR7RVT9_AQUAC|nr:transporter substrate-binding domain-containing protein [Pseudomonas alcaligenes]MBC9248869.1 ABC transporter substrate-binding protein [Pseudomonas alcaligenes]
MRFVSLLLAMFMAISAQAETLRIAMEGQFPPFEEIDQNGRLKGFNVDIANALCVQMQARCELQRFAWDDLIPALQEQRTDLILASMSITEERQALVDFTHHYAHTPAFFFAREDTVNEVIITPRRLIGKRIGVQRETTYDRFLTARYEAFLPIVRFASAAETYQALQRGEVDLVLDDAVSGYFGFLQSELGQGFERVGNAVKAPKFFGKGQGIAVRKGDDALRTRLDQALAVILENGVYRRIERQYFPRFSVY